MPIEKRVNAKINSTKEKVHSINVPINGIIITRSDRIGRQV